MLLVPVPIASLYEATLADVALIDSAIIVAPNVISHIAELPGFQTTQATDQNLPLSARPRFFVR